MGLYTTNIVYCKIYKGCKSKFKYTNIITFITDRYHKSNLITFIPQFKVFKTEKADADWCHANFPTPNLLSMNKYCGTICIIVSTISYSIFTVSKALNYAKVLINAK